jgi:hypothetical protein
MLPVELLKFFFIHGDHIYTAANIIFLPSGKRLANFRYRPVPRSYSQPSNPDCFTCAANINSHATETPSRGRAKMLIPHRLPGVENCRRTIGKKLGPVRTVNDHCSSVPVLKGASAHSVAAFPACGPVHPRAMRGSPGTRCLGSRDFVHFCFSDVVGAEITTSGGRIGAKFRTFEQVCRPRIAHG